MVWKKEKEWGFFDTSVMGILCAGFLFVEQCKIDPLSNSGPGMDESIELRGDIDCEYGSKVCTPCIDGLLDQLVSLSTGEDQSNLYQFKNGDLELQMNIFKHPQGIARLPDVEDDNWLLVTKNHARRENKAGVVSVRFSDVSSDGGAWMAKEKGQNVGEMKHFYSTFDNKHPGGCQLIGKYLAVAHEAIIDEIPEPTWISLYDVSDPRDIEESSRFCFDGIDASGIEYFMTDKGQAICVGLTRLSNGHYLMMALESRRRLPSDVGWFFMSSTRDLNQTGWDFLQFWHQDELLPDKNSFRTYENINMVTDCKDGNIYLLGFYGKKQSNAIDVFSLKKDADGKIVLEKVMEKTVITRRKGATFRAGASIHVTPSNELILYAIQKSGNKKWIVVEEFSAQKSSSANGDKVLFSDGN